MYRKWAWLGMLVVLGGCGFHAVGKGDMGGGGGGGGSGGGAGSGGSGGTGGSGGSGGSGGGGSGGMGDMGIVDNSCALPQLIAATSNLADTSGSGNGGQIVRFSLATGSPTRCSTLKGQGLLGSELWSAGYLAPGFVGAATPSEVYLVDADRDIIVWSKPAPGAQTSTPPSPLDTFAIQDAGGKMAIAFSFVNVTNPIDYSLSEIDAYHADGTVVPNTPWCTQSTSGCSSLGVTLSTPSVGANPNSPSHLYTVDTATPTAAWDVNPTGPSKTQYVAGNSDWLITIYAVKAGTTTRVAWLNATNSMTASIDYVNDSGTGTPMLMGPLKCSSGCASIVHVVPDPTAQDAFFLLCDGATQSQRTIVRLKSDGSCAQLLDG